MIIIMMNFYSPVSSKNQNPGRQSREMGKSLGREHNFEKVCFEPGTEYWLRRRVSGKMLMNPIILE